MKRPGKSLLLAGIAMIVVGFGGAAAVFAQGTEVDVQLSDFNIALNRDSAPAGEVTFNAMNTSAAEEHELVVVKTDVAHDAFTQRMDNPNQVDEEAAGEVIGEIEPDDLPPGASASAAFDLEAGNYVLLCNVPGHYQLGMHIGFTVTAAEEAEPEVETTATLEPEETAAPEAQATEAPAMAPPASGSGGLLDRDDGGARGVFAFIVVGLSLTLLGAMAIQARRGA